MADEIVIKSSIDTSGIDKGIREIQEKISNMSGAASKIGAEVKAQVNVAMDGIESMISSVSDKFELLMIDTFSSLADTITEQMDAAGTRYEEFTLEVIQGLSEGVVEACENFDRLSGEITGLEDVSRNAGGQVTNVVNNVTNNINNAVETTEKASSRLRVLSKIAAGLGKVFRGIVGHVQGFIGRIKSAGAQVAGFIKKFIGISALVGIVQRLYGEFQKAIGALEESGTHAGQVIKEFKAQLATLNNMISSAFAPIAEVVLPILTRLMSYLTGVIEKIGMMVAALTGAKTFTRAVQVQADYNKELNKTTESAKKLQNQLAGFDDINILRDPNTGDNPLNNDGLTTMFEDAPVDLEISSLADKIREMFERQDWDGLGKFAAEKINGFFEKIKSLISWDNVGEKITEVVNGITGTFNSLIDNVDFGLIGSTFGEGVNTIINTLDLLVTGVDWDRLGEQFGNLILGFVDTVSWDNFAQLIADGISAVFDLTRGFVTRLDKGGLGKKVAAAVNSIIEKISKADLGKKLGEILSSAFNIMMDFLIGIDYEGILRGIIKFFTDLFSQIEPEELGRRISDLIVKAVNGISKNLANVNIGKAIQGITDFINEMIKGIKVGDLLTALGVLITQIVLALPSLITSAFGSLFGGFGGLIEAIFGKNKFSDSAQNLANEIYNLSDQIDKGLQGAKDKANSHLDALSQDMSEHTKEIMSGGMSFSGGGQAFDAIAESAANMEAEVSGSLDRVGEKTEETFSNISRSTSEFLAGIRKNTVEELFTMVTEYETSTGKMYRVVDKNGREMYLNQKEYEDMISQHSKLTWENIKEVVDVNGKKMIRVVDKDGNDMLMSYTEVLKNANNSTGIQLKKIVDAYGGINLVPAGENALGGFARGLDNKWAFLDQKTKAQAARIVRNYKDAMEINSPSRVFRDEVGMMIPLGIAEGISAEENSVLNAIDSMTNAMYEEAIPGAFPDMALGGVVPYAVQVETDSIQTTLDNLTAALNSDDRITREDLADIISDAIREYMRIDFYIGDEQLARHSQSGAMKLNRRYSPVGG